MNTLALPLDRSACLRRVLFVDTATCIVMGALMSVDAAPLSVLFGLPAALLFWVGVSLFPVAAFMLWVATRRDLPRGGAWLAIAGNAGWVAGSVLVLFVFAPSALGTAFVIVQGVAVAVLAELEYAGLKRIGA